MAILLPLKLKRRTPNIKNGGRYKARTGNSHGPTPKWGRRKSVKGSR